MNPVSIALLNILYSFVGILLLGCAGIALYKLFDKMTPFDTHHELDNNNIAVGIVVGSIFLGVLIGGGIVIGMALN